MDIKNIIMYNYKNNSHNVDDYYNYFKSHGVKMLASSTNYRSGIVKYRGRKIYYYILNDNIEIEYCDH